MKIRFATLVFGVGTLLAQNSVAQPVQTKEPAPLTGKVVCIDALGVETELSVSFRKGYGTGAPRWSVDGDENSAESMVLDSVADEMGRQGLVVRLSDDVVAGIPFFAIRTVESDAGKTATVSLVDRRTIRGTCGGWLQGLNKGEKKVPLAGLKSIKMEFSTDLRKQITAWELRFNREHKLSQWTAKVGGAEAISGIGLVEFGRVGQELKSSAYVNVPARPRWAKVVWQSAFFIKTNEGKVGATFDGLDASLVLTRRTEAGELNSQISVTTSAGIQMKGRVSLMDRDTKTNKPSDGGGANPEIMAVLRLGDQTGVNYIVDTDKDIQLTVRPAPAGEKHSGSAKRAKSQKKP